MLTKEQVDRLETHAVRIFQSIVLPEITSEGCILVRDAGEILPDPVTTHHAVELCLELDGQLCCQVIDSACAWFARKPNASLHSPFFITTLLRANKFRSRLRAQIKSHLLRAQKPSGFFELYSGFLDGGSIFSTLWAARILTLLGENVRSSTSLLRAFSAIQGRWADVHRASFMGFFLELTASDGARTRLDSRASRVLAEILRRQQPDGFWDADPLYTAYILGNLSAVASPGRAQVRRHLAKGFRALFDLGNPPDGLPAPIASLKDTHVESVYLQAAIRSALSAVRYLRRFHRRNVAERVASTVLGAYASTYQSALRLETQLKKMNSQYGGIHGRFAHLDRFASPILKESSYESNVFVMMPFRQERDERYESIEKVLRSELKKQGLRAWLASDRQLAPQLWDNVAAFLLACKFGVAVFTRIERDRRIEEEFNPNVSLELGFCLSRGRQVLILKDSALRNLQTDLVGHLYAEFDFNQVTRQLPALIRDWARTLVRE